ncbi:hypothetical protein IWQ56_005987, partial [Coemansia nantahalensis]
PEQPATPTAPAPAPADATPADGWESLDGKVEEKSIYEYFPAHDAAVSQALFAPAATLQYLADHDDPILSRPKIRRTKPNGEVENTLPAAPGAAFTGSPESVGGNSDDELRGAVEDMTAIIVSADTSGNIRVFRKDINVCRFYGAGAGAAQSRASLFRTHTGPLARALSFDPRAPPPAGADLEAYALDPASPRVPPVPPLPARPATSVGDRSPPPLSGPRPSLWSRLGSRRQQKRRDSSMSTTHRAADEPALPHPRLPPGAAEDAHSLVAIPELSSASSGSTGACAHCGNGAFIDFAIAPAAGQPASSPASISVCASCRHVRNMPV